MRVLTSCPDIHKSLLNSKGIELDSRSSQNSAIGKDFHLIIASDVLNSNSAFHLDELAEYIQPNGFIILEETNNVDKSIIRNRDLLLVSKQLAGNKNYILFKKKVEYLEPIVIRFDETNFSWHDEFKTTLKSSKMKEQTIVFVSQNEPFSGKKKSQ